MPSRLAAFVLAALAAAGCGTPRVDPAVRGEPALIEIHAAFVSAVEWTRTNGEIAWESGWMGNSVVNATDDTTLGLCHEWQEIVWDAVLPTVERVGWRADGIEMNVGTFTEHHAVVVWDPARIERSALLAAPASAPAFVLDGWLRGEPDVYTVADWTSMPLVLFEDPALEDLTRDYGREPRFPGCVPPGP